MAGEEEVFEEEPEPECRKAYEDDSIPISSDQQLGQSILRTFARISDPDEIIEKKISRKVPVISIKTVLDKNGNEKQVEYISGWETKTWTEPRRVQPKYHELITDDNSRAFLNDLDLALSRDVVAYCIQIHSFARRYDLDLSLHHNNFADENNFMIVSSGAYKGKRVELAKTSRVESSYRADTTQLLKQSPIEKQKKKGFFGRIIP